MADTFVAKLNKKQDGSTYAVEEAFPTAAGVFEGLLGHDNIFNSGIRVYTGPQFSGDKVENFIISIPAETPWKRSIKIFSSAPIVYVTYETPGDIVEADDINTLQTSIVSTQVAVETKAELTHVDTQLLLKADKATTYTKTETDGRIEALIGAAPDALDTLQEIGAALNNDPNFAATMTTQLAGKVDKVAGKALSTEDYTTAEKTKLAGVQAGATNYTHPANHPPAIIAQDTNNRFVTDAEKADWNGKLPSLLSPGQAVKFDTDGLAFGRLFTLPGVPDWVGWTINAEFSPQGWVLDDTSKPGWFLKLDVRASLVEYAVYKIPAGANPHTNEYAVFKVSGADDETYIRGYKAFHAGNLTPAVIGAMPIGPLTWNQLKGV